MIKRKDCIQMKIRTAKYVIREGIANLSRNKLMSVAAFGMVVVSLLIFGISYILSQNLKDNIEKWKDKPQLQVFCDPDATDDVVESVYRELRASSYIKSISTVTKKEAFDKVRNMLGEDKSLLEGLNEDFLSVSFVIKLSDIGKATDAAAEFKQLAGVSSVKYRQDYLDILTKASDIINLVGVLMVMVLLIFSVFIIANTIKLTVFARRKEIGIMKYIGATDWFIRWPFIIEGIMIGVMGAILAVVLLMTGYRMANGVVGSLAGNLFTLTEGGKFAFRLGVYSILTGLLVGSLASYVSIRKHLMV